MQTEQYGERTAVLAQLGHPRDGHRRILVMIEVYVDESGIHDGARALVVAGYWGSPAAWKRFEGGWMAALRRHGVHLHEFHARNLFPRRGRFADPGLDCDVLEDELLKAIESAKIHPFAQVLDVDEFWHLSERERRYLTGAIPNGPNVEDAGRPKRPYWVPFYGVLDLICGTHVPVGSKAHFFYGIDRPARQYAREVFAQIK